MDAAQRAFLSAVSSERQKSWNKAAINYEEVLSLIYKIKWNKNLNKEKLRLLLFECHFHCAVALQNFENYQKALRHFRRAMEVVSWRKDECQAGCITGRVLHLHVPTLARIASCYIHEGDLKEALDNVDKGILLDFRNPDLFCIRSLVNFFLRRHEKALSDASFAIQLNPTQVCGWLFRGLFKKTKKEANYELNNSKQEPDLEKACDVNPDAVMFVNIKDLRAHFQSMFDRFLPSMRVSHSISVLDVIEVELPTKQPMLSPPKFMCGVAKPKQRIRTCPPQEKKHSERFLERFHIEPCISHHKYSLNANNRHPERRVSRATLSLDTCASRVPRLTLREVVNTKCACVCREERFIGIRDRRERQKGLESAEDISYTSERMYSKKWLQDRIPTKIPDFGGNGCKTGFQQKYLTLEVAENYLNKASRVCIKEIQAKSSLLDAFTMQKEFSWRFGAESFRSARQATSHFTRQGRLGTRMT